MIPIDTSHRDEMFSHGYFKICWPLLFRTLEMVAKGNTFDASDKKLWLVCVFNFEPIIMSQLEWNAGAFSIHSLSMYVIRYNFCRIYAIFEGFTFTRMIIIWSGKKRSSFFGPTHRQRSRGEALVQRDFIERVIKRKIPVKILPEITNKSGTKVKKNKITMKLDRKMWKEHFMGENWTKY